MARGNPTLAFIRAAAEHAEGLLTSDVSFMLHASTELPDPGPALRGGYVGVLRPRRAGTARRSAAEEALREYDRLGARLAVARTRRRLRQLGVRRRYWAS